MRRILTDQDIKDIKREYRQGVRQTELAQKYSVSVMTISLWLRENPYEVLNKKKRKRIDYSGLPRCKICTRILKFEGEECNCRAPRKYYNDLEDLSKYL